MNMILFGYNIEKQTVKMVRDDNSLLERRCIEAEATLIANKMVAEIQNLQNAMQSARDIIASRDSKIREQNQELTYLNSRVGELLLEKKKSLMILQS